jgi:hypothetical protein
MFQIHHVLPRDFAEPIHFSTPGQSIQYSRTKKSDGVAIDQGLANALNSSPHTGGHLATYSKGFDEFLTNLRVHSAFNSALAGDPAALDNLSGELNTFVAAAKYALAKKHLFANTPVGMTPELANEKNKEWFANWEKYAEDNRDEIQQMQDTVDQLHNSGRRDDALWWPVLSPTSNLSLADKIDTLRRYGVTSPTSQQFTMIGPIPDLPGFNSPVVDTHLPGDIQPSLEGLKQSEGFTPIDPLSTYGLPGFPVVDPLSQGLGQLPPAAAIPQDLQVLQFNQETGRPLTFSDGSPVMGPALPNGDTPSAKALLYGTAAAGALFLAPELLPLLPLLAGLGLVGLAGTAASATAFAGTRSDAGARGGGIFSAGTAPYNPFNDDQTSPGASGGAGNHLGSASRPPLIDGTPFQQESTSGDTFVDRFGSWTETSAGTMPAQASGALGAPTPGSVGAVAPEDVRRLTRVNSSNAVNAFPSGTSPVPHLPPSEFDDRFGNWSTLPDDGQSRQTSRPVGAFADEPSYLIPPPIWGLEDPGLRTGAEEWFSRWIRPLLRQDRME